MTNDKIVDYEDYFVQHDALIAYMQVMIALEDWHGVADLAMDMRELDAKQKAKNGNDNL